jgi:hypothetical protein
MKAPWQIAREVRMNIITKPRMASRTVPGFAGIFGGMARQSHRGVFSVE